MAAVGYLVASQKYSSNLVILYFVCFLLLVNKICYCCCCYCSYCYYQCSALCYVESMRSNITNLLYVDKILLNRYYRQCWNCRRLRGGGVKLNPPPPSSCLQKLIFVHFWVKIGFKVQSRCKLSNSSTSDHPGFLANSNTDYRWSLEDGYCDVQWGDTFSITIIAARMRVNDEWRLTRWSMALSVTLLLLLLAGMLCRRVTRGQWTIDQWFRHLSSSITNRIAAVRRRQHQRCCTTLPFGRRIAPSVRLYASANL